MKKMELLFEYCVVAVCMFLFILYLIMNNG